MTQSQPGHAGRKGAWLSSSLAMQRERGHDLAPACHGGLGNLAVRGVVVLNTFASLLPYFPTC